MPLNSHKRPPCWNSTSGFDFDHITAVDMSFCTSLRLRNFIHGRKLTWCRYSRWRIFAILDFRGPIMGCLKSLCTTSYVSPYLFAIYTPCPEKRCHWFFCCNFYKYWRIFIIFVHNFIRECQSHWRENFVPYICYVATMPCESLRHKSNTFHTILALCTCLYRSHLRKPVSIKQTRQQKVRGSKFMFKMSTIHANTCIQWSCVRKIMKIRQCL